MACGLQLKCLGLGGEDGGRWEGRRWRKRRRRGEGERKTGKGFNTQENFIRMNSLSLFVCVCVCVCVCDCFLLRTFYNQFVCFNMTLSVSQIQRILEFSCELSYFVALNLFEYESDAASPTRCLFSQTQSITRVLNVVCSEAFLQAVTAVR